MTATQTRTPVSFDEITCTPITFAGARLVGYTEHPSTSVGSDAFTADVDIHNKKVGILRNDGSGGEDIFHPASSEGYAAFLAAEKSFPGIADAETGAVYDLMNALVEVASLAKRYSGRKVTFMPDVDPEDLLRTWKYPKFTAPAKYAKNPSISLPALMMKTGATTVLYPQRDRGYWFYRATR